MKNMYIAVLFYSLKYVSTKCAQSSKYFFGRFRLDSNLAGLFL